MIGNVIDEIADAANATLGALIQSVATANGVTLNSSFTVEKTFDWETEHDRASFPVFSIEWQTADTNTYRPVTGIRDTKHTVKLRYIYQDSDRTACDNHMRYIPDAVMQWMDVFPISSRVAGKRIQQLAPPGGEGPIIWHRRISDARMDSAQNRWYEVEVSVALDIQTREAQSIGNPVVNVAVTTVGGVTVFHPGDTAQLVATLTDVNAAALTGRTVQWSSQDPRVSNVGTSGLLLAVTPGNINIYATSERVTGEIAIIVLYAVNTVTVTPNPFTLSAGSPTQQLTVVLKDINGNVLTGRTITYQSGNTGVATVNSSGLVTRVAAGTVVITATSELVNGTATGNVS